MFETLEAFPSGLGWDALRVAKDTEDDFGPLTLANLLTFFVVFKFCLATKNLLDWDDLENK